MKTQLAPQKIAAIAEALRSLSILQGTGSTYGTSHSVFGKVVEDLMPHFREALKGTRGLPLLFREGQVRVGVTPIEPGSDVFRRLSRNFENAGIQGVLLRAGLTARDLVALIDIMATEADNIRSAGLQSLLARRHIRSIEALETEPTRCNVVNPDTGSLATPAYSPKSVRSTSAYAPSAWSIDSGGKNHAPGYDSDAMVFRHFREFVHGAISAMARQEAEVTEIEDIISTEFEQKLREKIHEIRKTSEQRIRRLQCITDLALRELELLHVPAIVLDSKLNIMSSNSLGREVIGDLVKIPEDSPLETFVLSGHERETITINGAKRCAHLLSSTVRESGDAIMLVSFE